MKLKRIAAAALGVAGALGLLAAPANAYPDNDQPVAITALGCRTTDETPSGALDVTCTFYVASGASAPDISWNRTRDFVVSQGFYGDGAGGGVYAYTRFFSDCSGGDLTVYVAAGPGYAGNTLSEAVTCSAPPPPYVD